MSTKPKNPGSRTLWLTGMLHAFTHVYHVALMPLYLLMAADLHLTHPGQAPMLVTIMGLAYFLPSYPAGILADRFNRKHLLTIGLLINAAGFIGLSTAASLTTATVWAAVAGLGGSFFHPAATSMIARMYPVGTGKALGLIGIGASVGFFIGPIFAGWRATASGSWRTPVLELGVAGLVGAVVFAWFSDEEHATPAVSGATAPRPSLFPGAALWGLFILASLAFSLRDFAGFGVGSLGSFFLQQAQDQTPQQTGEALSTIFLASAISNPLFGSLSDRGRGRWIATALGCAALVVTFMPHLPPGWTGLAFPLYGFFFLATYPMVEAALMTAVPDAVRGRVFGVFITIGGMIGNLSHWTMGLWIKSIGSEAAHDPASYHSIYLLLAAMIVTASLGLPALAALKRAEDLALAHPPRPATGPTP